jgi:hypothetical protein
LLRIYESAGSRALEQQIFKILQDQDRPHEVEVIRTVRIPQPPHRSWLRRFLIG